MLALKHGDGPQIDMIGGIDFLGESWNLIEIVLFLPQRCGTGLLQILCQSRVLEKEDVFIADSTVLKTVLPEDVLDFTAEAFHRDQLVGRV